MNHLELEALGHHAVALQVAAEILAEASQRELLKPATAEEWLKLILEKGKARYDAMSPAELQEYLSQVIRSLN